MSSRKIGWDYECKERLNNQSTRIKMLSKQISWLNGKILGEKERWTEDRSNYKTLTELAISHSANNHSKNQSDQMNKIGLTDLELMREKDELKSNSIETKIKEEKKEIDVGIQTHMQIKNIARSKKDVEFKNKPSELLILFTAVVLVFMVYFIAESLDLARE
ncbi:hypothetical protein SNEBB_001870 [Seison nebaliae]|nr:hypothetical protein SNEBB_001870 [Seison nebaliae]